MYENSYEFRYLNSADRRWRRIFCNSYSQVIDLVREHETDTDKIEIAVTEE